MKVYETAGVKKEEGISPMKTFNKFQIARSISKIAFSVVQGASIKLVGVPLGDVGRKKTKIGNDLKIIFFRRPFTLLLPTNNTVKITLLHF